MGRLDGKTALVTGGSRGIGRAIALDLASEGARVAINYHSNEAKAAEVVDEVAALGSDCFSIRADIGHPDEARNMVAKVIEHFDGQLDILVNNAGITRDKSIKRMDDAMWDEVVRTNLGSCFACMSAALPTMIEQHSGRIINISSMNGQIGAFGQANYSASKGGIIALTRTAAMELANSGITVNTVAPGFTLTDMFAEVPDKVQEQIKTRIPLGRLGKPEEIAKAVTFLAADGDYITGQQINVNGGAHM